MRLFLNLTFLALYTVGFLGFAIGLVGGGHGSLLFISPLLTWVLFIMAFLLISKAKKKPVLYIILVSITIHYVVSLWIGYLMELGDNFEHTFMMINRSPIFIALGALWYLSGQIIFWRLLIKTIRQRVSMP